MWKVGNLREEARDLEDMSLVPKLLLENPPVVKALALTSGDAIRMEFIKMEHLGNSRLNPGTNHIPVSVSENGLKDSEALGPDTARETC